jgi:heparan-alpha-glucosaminide N-acetyltransferase
MTSNTAETSTVDTRDAVAAKLPARRCVSIDVYRGMVMFLMLAEVLHWSGLVRYRGRLSSTTQSLLDTIVFHTSHVPWRGCSLHDLIQPGFSFLVGAALAFSFAKRSEQGQSYRAMLIHAIGRSFILVFFGIFLRSLGKMYTNFTFDDTLTQIGLGYTFLFLFAGRKWYVSALGAGAILVGYWALFAFSQLPAPDFDYASVGVPANWPHHEEGFGAHWNKNSNVAWAFDVWWMNLFFREEPFAYSSGGYCTLSFIPTLATMLLGLVAGEWLRADWTLKRRFAHFATATVVCLSIAWGLETAGLCPIVKRIWTPSWTLWSGGLCFAWLFLLYLICDFGNSTRWAFFFRVIGANSIVAYTMSWTMEEWTKLALRRHFDWLIGRVVPQSVETLVYGGLVLTVFWLILYWLYRQKIFVRI